MARSRVIVEFADRPAYSVRIGAELVSRLGADVRELAPDAARCLVVVDADSRQRCLPLLKDSLSEAGFRVMDASIPAVDPDDSWSCVAELHQVLGDAALEGAPVVACGGVQAMELAAFAAATYGAVHPLVLVPASLAATMLLVGVDFFELDAGLPHSVRVPALPAYALVDIALLACESEAEAELGLHELELASRACEDDYRAWQSENIASIAAFDADACILALTEVLSSRANLLGTHISSRLVH